MKKLFLLGLLSINSMTFAAIRLNLAIYKEEYTIYGLTTSKTALSSEYDNLESIKNHLKQTSTNKHNVNCYSINIYDSSDNLLCSERYEYQFNNYKGFENFNTQLETIFSNLNNQDKISKIEVFLSLERKNLLSWFKAPSEIFFPAANNQAQISNANVDLDLEQKKHWFSWSKVVGYSLLAVATYYLYQHLINPKATANTNVTLRSFFNG